jgi:hypothetical protein
MSKLKFMKKYFLVHLFSFLAPMVFGILIIGAKIYLFIYLFQNIREKAIVLQ